ncbi:MAG: P-II family nitrogen regulator [Wolinella sp.]
MKKIEAVIKPFKLEEVANALLACGISGMTVSEVRGYGRQKGHVEGQVSTDFTVDFIPKLKIEVIVKDAEENSVVDAIIKSARTGKIGDGKIFVSTIDKAVRIRTGESDESAI